MADLLQRSSKAVTERLPLVTTSDDGLAAPVDVNWAWTAVTKRWWLILAAAFAVLIPTGAYLYFTPTQYRATAVIQVSPDSTKALPYRDLLGPLGSASPNYELYMKTYDGILKSRELHTRAHDRLKSAADSFAVDDLEAELEEPPEVQRIEGSELVALSYVATDPKLAAAAANIWAEEFIGFDLERKQTASEQATSFLREQLHLLKIQVEESEAAVIAYARHKGILDLDDSHENVIRRRFSQLNEELAKTEKAYVSQKAEHAGVEDLSMDGLPESLKNPLITEREARVFEAERELANLRAQFDNKWPAVMQKQQELNLLREQLQRAKAEALGQAFRESRMKLNAASREHEMLRKSVEKQAALVNTLNKDLAEYKTLNRDFQTTNQLYQTLLQRLKETGVVAGLELGNISFVDRAVADPDPYRPRTALTFLLAFAASLVLGAGICIGVESANDTLSRPSETEGMGLPLLGWVPKLDVPKTAGALTGHRVGKQAIAASRSPGSASGADGELTNAQWCARESYRMLCSSLVLTRAGSPPRVILVSSSTPGEGKTTAVTALGATLAELGHATLLIDGDLRKPSLSRVFDATGREGLSTYLSGGAMKPLRTGIPHLSCLPAGPQAPNPIALFSSDRMTQLVSEVSRQFSFVIIDSPPILGLADATVLSSKVDGVILIAQAGRTPRSMIRESISRLQRAGAVLLGAAVNQVEIREVRYSYYRRYADVYGKPEAGSPEPEPLAKNG